MIDREARKQRNSHATAGAWLFFGSVAIVIYAIEKGSTAAAVGLGILALGTALNNAASLIAYAIEEHAERLAK